ncbi:MAG: hypothetical protein U5K69_30200 [Balneolaceae bacterium]|nr:hypothetical protein [Balneolaceae bacterium]
MEHHAGSRPRPENGGLFLLRFSRNDQEELPTSWENRKKTRHIFMHNHQAAPLSPWSIHCGSGHIAAVLLYLGYGW